MNSQSSLTDPDLNWLLLTESSEKARKEKVLFIFIEEDPIKHDLAMTQSLNPYQYGYNNPINNADPSGRFSWGDVWNTVSSAIFGQLPAAVSAVTQVATQVYSNNTNNSNKQSTPQSQTYKVKSGDTLGTIAQQFYGDSSLYMLIANANGISNPNLISVGQVLTIPARDTRSTGSSNNNNNSQQQATQNTSANTASVTPTPIPGASVAPSAPQSINTVEPLRASGRLPTGDEQCMQYAQDFGDSTNNKVGRANGLDEGAYNVLYEGNDPLLVNNIPTAKLKPEVLAGSLAGVTDFTQTKLHVGGYIVWDRGAGGMSRESGHIAVVELVAKDHIVISQANYYTVDAKGNRTYIYWMTLTLNNMVQGVYAYK